MSDDGLGPLRDAIGRLGQRRSEAEAELVSTKVEGMALYARALELGMTRTDFAATIGISRATLATWEAEQARRG